MIFFLSSKWVIKQWRQLTTSATHLAQELLTNGMYSAVLVQEVLQRDESLEDEECSGWPSKVDNDQLRAITEANPLKTTQEVAEELNVDHSTVIWYLKQIGKLKKLGKWVPHELTANQKNGHFEVSFEVFSYPVQQQ